MSVSKLPSRRDQRALLNNMSTITTESVYIIQNGTLYTARRDENSGHIVFYEMVECDFAKVGEMIRELIGGEKPLIANGK